VDYPGDVFAPIARWLTGCTELNLVDEVASLKCAEYLSLPQFGEYIKEEKEAALVKAEAAAKEAAEVRRLQAEIQRLETERVAIEKAHQATRETAPRLVVCARCMKAIFQEVPVRGSLDGKVPWHPCTNCVFGFTTRHPFENVTFLSKWYPEAYFQITGGILWVYPSGRGMDFNICIPDTVLNKG
jgi:hypothetical protein